MADRGTADRGAVVRGTVDRGTADRGAVVRGTADRGITGRNTADRGAAGSLTIEAAFSLTLFLFTVILLSVPMEILDVQRKIQMTLEAASRELSQMAYISYRNGLGDQEAGAGTKAENSELAGLFAEGALQIYLDAKVKSAAGNRRLERLDCSGSGIEGKGEHIDLRAEYDLKLPFSVFSLDSVHLSSRSYRRGWIGGERGVRHMGGNQEEEQMVYVGETSARYHLSPSCHYLSNAISSVSYDAIKEYRNKSGRRYKPCSVCGKGAGSGQAVFILPNGESYHSRADCSSLASYVKKVPLSQVEHLGACSYCGGG